MLRRCDVPTTSRSARFLFFTRAGRSGKHMHTVRLKLCWYTVPKDPRLSAKNETFQRCSHHSCASWRVRKQVTPIVCFSATKKHAKIALNRRISIPSLGFPWVWESDDSRESSVSSSLRSSLSRNSAVLLPTVLRDVTPKYGRQFEGWRLEDVTRG